MKKLLVIAALLATVGAACGPPPPPPPPPSDGAGCRDLPNTEQTGTRQSVSWDGSYTGRIELFYNAICDGLPVARYAALQGDPGMTGPVAGAACVDLAVASLPTDTNVIGPFMFRYQEVVANQFGDVTGIPEDLWMCAAPYSGDGSVLVWPTE